MINAAHWTGLIAALMIGLVIGLERGWRLRAAGDGERVAGIRTFALIALMGGVVGQLAQTLTAWLVPVALGGVILVIGLGYWRISRNRRDIGITTEIAALLTFLLGVLASHGEPLLAIAGGVVTATLLGFKPRLHALLDKLDGPELRAILQLALITAVVLPFLPNTGYGPWEVLNPRRLWMMVVLISAIGFVGHFAVRVVGARRGVLLTGLFAGLASSTALTLALSRAGRQQPSYQPIFAASVVLASTTMFPRVLVLVAVIHPLLLTALYVPIALMSFVGFIATVLLAIAAGRATGQPSHPPMQHPFELATALRFAVLLAIVMVAAEALRRYAGDVGVYTVSLLSGLTDVDAITLSITQMADDGLSAAVAARAILIAAMANTTVKLGLAVFIGRGRMAVLVASGLGAVLIVAGAWLGYTLWV
jgi:uncharacterized membrane protein (DUF4010 family)